MEAWLAGLSSFPLLLGVLHVGYLLVIGEHSDVVQARHVLEQESLVALDDFHFIEGSFRLQGGLFAYSLSFLGDVGGELEGQALLGAGDLLLDGLDELPLDLVVGVELEARHDGERVLLPVGVLQCDKDQEVLRAAGFFRSLFSSLSSALLALSSSLSAFLASVFGLLASHPDIALYCLHVLVYAAVQRLVGFGGLGPALVDQVLGRDSGQVKGFFKNRKHVGLPAEVGEVRHEGVNEDKLGFDVLEQEVGIGLA